MKQLVKLAVFSAFVLSSGIVSAQTFADDYPETDARITAVENGLAEVDGKISDAIADEATRSDAYADAAVEAEALVTDGKIADAIAAEATVTDGKIADAITAEATVTDGKIADAITAEATVTESKIADAIAAESTVTESKIAAAIADEATRSDAYADAAVEAEALVTDGKIAAAITAEATVTEGKIAAAIADEATRSDAYADAIGTAANEYTDDAIAAEVTRSDAYADAVGVAANAYTDSEIAAEVIRSNNYADNAVLTAVGDRNYTSQNVVTAGSNVTDAVSALDSAVGNIDFSEANNEGVRTASDLTSAVNAIDNVLGDIGSLNDRTQGDFSDHTTVTDALVKLDQDFHRGEDGNIHLGAHSFLFSDGTGGSTLPEGTIQYRTEAGEELAVNFTTTPTVNGVNMATQNDINRIQEENHTGMASVAALTALQPLGINSGRLQFALGTGFYQGETAVAAGANFYATDRISFNAGVASDSNFDNHVIKAGVSFGFLKPKRSYTVTANNVTINAQNHTAVQASKDAAFVMTEQIKALSDRIAALEAELANK